MLPLCALRNPRCELLCPELSKGSNTKLHPNTLTGLLLFFDALPHICYEVTLGLGAPKAEVLRTFRSTIASFDFVVRESGFFGSRTVHTGQLNIPGKVIKCLLAE